MTKPEREQIRARADAVHARSRKVSLERLTAALKSFSSDELRWDFHCNIGTETRAAVMAELQARGESTEGYRRRQGGDLFIRPIK